MLLVLCASARADTNTQAEAALVEGRRHYDLQEWDAAIAKFKESYKLRAAPQPLFNIAQAYRLKGDCEQALQAYKAYKRNYPDATNMAKTDKFIREMDECTRNKPPPTVTEPAKPDATKPEPPPQQPPPVERKRATSSSGSGLKITGIVTGAIGVIAVGVGGVFAYKADQASEDARAVRVAAPWEPAIDDRGETAERNARILMAVGGAAIVTGTVLYLLGARSNDEPSVAVVPRSDGAAAVWSCAF
jgi:tetratricopeptide (TPR) repeat protein